MKETNAYLMENSEESMRLEIKTDPDAVRSQALWCGMKPGMRILDVGCGSGKTTSILYDIIQPGGEITGIDYSAERIAFAKEHYGDTKGLHFRVHDFMDPFEQLGLFDMIWVRFVLEYYLTEGSEIVRNLKKCLKPGGYLCLLDLDCNCMGHYDLPPQMQGFLSKIMSALAETFNFDAYAGRKLYSYLYDHGFSEIEAHLVAHHLIYGEAKKSDIFNWFKKVEVAAKKLSNLLTDYPGGYEEFCSDFRTFFLDPRRFTYTPLIICKGKKTS